MLYRTTLILAGSILAGLFLGLAIRRARGPAALSAVEARSQLPSRERVNAALIRAEIRDLESRLAVLRDEDDALLREKLRLETLSQPPPPPSPQSLVRANLRTLLGEHRIDVDHAILAWIQKDPSNIAVLIKLTAEVFREKDWGKYSYRSLGEFIYYFISGVPLEDQKKVLDFVQAAQRTEPDPLGRALMLETLHAFGMGLPADQLGELARAFRESRDAHFRDSAFTMLLNDAAAYGDLIRDAVRQGNPDERAGLLLKAWDKRALPGGELRNLARELMKSESPGAMIMDAQDWVPKFINPLAPQETVALFEQTLSKPIEPLHKAISMMVMGSIATLFPARPGRDEIDRFVASTDSAPLKEFGGKVLSLIDEGKGYAEIRKLNPLQYGFEIPKK
jgi:hypothetical protein